ncbi:MAG: hypothetical protein EA426_15375 [Spirochaetaceae bacterium]|nr:MAG: hypothetical protein EA426_15375 [Spirochaetaceae bacterium]
MPLWVSFALILAGILAIWIEIFVPAGGVIGLAGGGIVISAVVLGFVHHDPVTGSLVMVTALILTPTALVVGFRLFPNTFLGKRLILGKVEAWRNRTRTEDGSGGAELAAEYGLSPDNIGGMDGYAHLVGKSGEAMTVLRPSGTAIIDDARYSVVSSGEYIEKGERITVARVEGNRIVVRRARVHDTDAQTAT